MGKIAEKLEKIINIWIHFYELGNYDKVPKIKEYDHLAKTIEKYILDAKPEKMNKPCDKIMNDISFEVGYNSSMEEWEDNLKEVGDG